MKRIGLTGSIGMGKSTAASMLRDMGLPVYDADATVHRLLASGGAAVKPVLALFPDAGSITSGIDRNHLGGLVFGDPAALRRLESVLHPMVRAAQRRFIDACKRRRARAVILDIPLLFERPSGEIFDAVILVTAPALLQRQRVLRRPGMTRTKFADILARQMPDAEKRRRTRYIATTGLGRRSTRQQLQRFLQMIAPKGH
jgi:dephospho-CoA kinase